MINNGLISYLTAIHNLSILKTTGLIGHRLENWFLNEIQTWMDTSPKRHQINFWRTASNAEVDFVVTFGAEVIPFEVTYATQIDSKKFNNLKGFMHAAPQAKVGIFCYNGPLVYDRNNRIFFIPAWMI